MHDKINISSLKVFGTHGVLDIEKKEGQFFYIDAQIGLDMSKAAASDDLDKTVNYADICDKIAEYTSSNSFDLIETLAMGLCELILEYSFLIKSVSITVNKPEAPIKQTVANLSVTISRKWHRAYISYGSNLGESLDIITKSIAKLSSVKGIMLTQKSKTIKTKPYGGVQQPDFYNGMIEIMTYLEPFDLLKVLNNIENEAGRVRTVKWGPRTLDLDIIFYDDYVIHEPNLCIPHIDMQNRDFVLVPLNEIAPYAYHPVYQKTVKELLAEYISKPVIEGTIT